MVRKWLMALESNDSIALIRTAINRPEFAYLVYPFSPSATAPLYQSPSIVWGQVSNASVQGVRRILNKHGGRSLSFLGYKCAEAPKKEGENRIWTDCTVRYLRAPGDSADERFFGAIIERHGRFKFFSLANDI